MVDIASLVCFRVAFGALMIVDLRRYSHYAWIKAAYVAPAFHFTYYGFGWVRPWPGPGMYLHVLALALAAAGVMLAPGIASARRYSAWALPISSSSNRGST